MNRASLLPRSAASDVPARRLARLAGIRLTAAAALLMTAGSASAQLTADAVFSKVKPRQPDAPIDVPSAEQVAASKVENKDFGSNRGYVVIGPDGQTLRELVDTTKDGQLNQFRFFQMGLETYRETMQGPKGSAPVEYRWLNTGGTRQGIDQDGDKSIDRWVRISAEEATREAVAALAAGDAKRMQALMITKADVQQLGLAGDVAAAMLRRASDVPGQMKKALGTKLIDRSTSWERSDSAMLMPVLVPSEAGKADQDIVVYENVTAVARTGGDDVFLNVGEVVQVGNAWKLTSVPQPLDTTQQLVTDGGLLLQPQTSSPGVMTEEQSEAMQALLAELDKLDRNRPDYTDRKVATEWNVDRAVLLKKIIAEADGREQKATFMQQRIDGISSASLLGAYPNPLTSMKKLEEEISDDFSEFLPYVVYRRIQVESGERVAAAKEPGDVQKWYLGELDKFVRKYPDSNDAPDAMWQLGSQYELAGDIKRARGWYEANVKKFADTPGAQKSAGALYRMGLAGKSLTLSGDAIGGGKVDLSKYRGKVVAVVFWATWQPQFVEKLPELIDLKKKYGQNGFEVVGVNLDVAGVRVPQFLIEQNVNFPSINAGPQGTESPLARRFGLVQIPTIMLVDKAGRVVDASVAIEQLENQVPRLLLAAMNDGRAVR